MPTYEYECLNCGHHFEKFQMMTDKPIKACPKCKKSVRRVIGMGSGIIFKGKGFYATDYRKSKPEQNNKEKTVKKTCPEDKSSKNPSCGSCKLKQNQGG